MKKCIPLNIETPSYLEDGVLDVGGLRGTVSVCEPLLPLGHGVPGDLDDDGVGGRVEPRGRGRLGLRVHGLEARHVRDQTVVRVVHATELDRVAALNRR